MKACLQVSPKGKLTGGPFLAPGICTAGLPKREGSVTRIGG